MNSIVPKISPIVDGHDLRISDGFEVSGLH